MNNTVPGSELTKEPFRWDQRLFSLVLRIPAVPPPDTMLPFIPAADNSPIDVMCEVTGGTDAYFYKTIIISKTNIYF